MFGSGWLSDDGMRETSCSTVIRSTFGPLKIVTCNSWVTSVAPPGGASPLWVDVQKLCNMCVLSIDVACSALFVLFKRAVKCVCVCVCFHCHGMELLRITRQIHCKAVEQRATLIHRQYNRDWGTSYSRRPIDPYLTSPSLLQNHGGATGSASP